MATPTDHEVALVWLESGRAALEAGRASLEKRSKAQGMDAYWSEAIENINNDIASIAHSRHVLMRDGGYIKDEPAVLAPVHLSGEFFEGEVTT